MSVTRNGKMMEMRKYCIVSVLLLGLSFGASAHYTPEFVEKDEGGKELESHDATTDFHDQVYAGCPAPALALWRR